MAGGLTYLTAVVDGGVLRDVEPVIVRKE